MADPPEPMRADETLVIVGAGLAGVKVAEGARDGGFSGRIVLIGEEPHAPYDRPPLSKAVLMTEGEEANIGLWSEAAPAPEGLELLLGHPVTEIDRAGRRVRLSNGQVVAYDRLVLATGSSLRTLPALPPRAPGVHYLRSLDDALALRRALAAARHVTVIGAGVIGLEVAAAAVKAGCQVTVVEAADRVMGRAASPPICAFMAERHRAEGVDLRLGTTVSEAGRDGLAVRLVLSDGSALVTDAVLVGIGVIPNDGLARACGLEGDDRGVPVDAYGRTDDPAIHAAGEVAFHDNLLYGRRERQETWAHALAHGEHVGRSLAAPGEGYAEPASYWSDQYDLTLNVFGAPTGEVDVVRGDPADGKFLVFHLAGGKVAGVSAINDARGLRAAKALIGASPDPALLADLAADLKALVQSRAA